MPRPAMVLRVAPTPLRADRLSELERIFATTVVVTNVALRDPATVSEIARSLPVDAIVLDVVAPSAMSDLVTELTGHVLLQPRWVQTRTSRGEHQPAFAGYALLGSDGVLRSLADGELALAE